MNFQAENLMNLVGKKETPSRKERDPKDTFPVIARLRKEVCDLRHTRRYLENQIIERDILLENERSVKAFIAKSLIRFEAYR
ncbi:hypothetical protein [Leptospira jelokensis]|uniref:Uncharacterized protein n=1 Tax=Leptospira jelokensis TaxID=2484931 RepID=A0A4Z0ZNB4_9LEPT|nr:hypothetical protein [Leptospira jelokensis]TGL58591.1 hypothetical protein EHQ62_16990 [Leptospira jelokensis]